MREARERLASAEKRGVIRRTGTITVDRLATDLRRALDALERVRALADTWSVWGGVADQAVVVADLRAALDGSGASTEVPR